MCGITGWVDFNRELSTEKEIIERMAGRLDKRGPDEAGFFSAPGVLFGHRRLSVVDPEGGRQPMTREKGGYNYTIVYNGELYNTEELRRALCAKGWHFRSYSDTEVLLTAYIEYGTECLQHLNGIYAFAIWDEKEKRLIMARDRLGVKPLFYYQKKGMLVFGSEIKALLAHPGIEPVIGEEGIMEIFGLGPARTPGSGVFREIKELKPGYYSIFDRGKFQIREYWQLVSRPHGEDLQTTVEHLRDLFCDTVRRQLVSDVPVCTFLSGGVDSSAISAVTAEIFRERGGRLNTFSIDYEDNKCFFKSNEYQPDSDQDWVYRVAGDIESSHQNIQLNNIRLVEALKEAVIANDLPGMADIDSSLYLFTGEIKKSHTVALSGECADEIFGGYPWFKRKEDIRAETFPWSRSVLERKGLLSEEFQNLPLTEYVDSQYRSTLHEVPRLEGEPPFPTRMREIFYLNLKWFMVTLLNRKDRMSMANSLEVRVPFADHRLVEYAWNIPWELKFYNGIEKGILREALRGIIPAGVLQRRKSPYPKTHHPDYTRAVQEWMRRIVADKAAPLWQLINREKAAEITATAGKSFGKPWFGQLMTGPQLLAYLIQVNLWLDEYGVKIC